MVSNIVFHVGAPKTGSTYLQKRLRQNSEVLAQHNIFYPIKPGFERVAANAKLITIALDNDLAGKFASDFPKVNIPALDPQEEFDALVDLCPTQTDTLILSSEKMRCWQAQALAKVLGNSVPCRIILFVRKQDDWLDSYFNQLVKNRNATSIDDTLAKIISGTQNQFFYPDWLYNFTKWKESFDDCHVIFYDDKEQPFFDEFIRLSGLPKSAVFTDIEKSNQSLSLNEIVYLANVSNRMSEAEFRQRRHNCKQATQMLPARHEKYSFLNGGHRQILKDRFQDNNKELLRLLGRNKDHLAIGAQSPNHISIGKFLLSEEYLNFKRTCKALNDAAPRPSFLPFKFLAI